MPTKDRLNQRYKNMEKNDERKSFLDPTTAEKWKSSHCYECHTNKLRHRDYAMIDNSSLSIECILSLS